MSTPFDEMRRALVSQSIQAQGQFIEEQSSMDAAFRKGEFRKWIEDEAAEASGDSNPSDDGESDESGDSGAAVGT